MEVISPAYMSRTDKVGIKQVGCPSYEGDGTSTARVANAVRLIWQQLSDIPKDDNSPSIRLEVDDAREKETLESHVSIEFSAQYATVMRGYINDWLCRPRGEAFAAVLVLAIIDVLESIVRVSWSSSITPHIISAETSVKIASLWHQWLRLPSIRTRLRLVIRLRRNLVQRPAVSPFHRSLHNRSAYVSDRYIITLGLSPETRAWHCKREHRLRWYCMKGWRVRIQQRRARLDFTITIPGEGANCWLQIKIYDVHVPDRIIQISQNSRITCSRSRNVTTSLYLTQEYAVLVRAFSVQDKTDRPSLRSTYYNVISQPGMEYFEYIGSYHQGSGL